MRRRRAKKIFCQQDGDDDLPPKFYGRNYFMAACAFLASYFHFFYFLGGIMIINLVENIAHAPRFEYGYGAHHRVKDAMIASEAGRVSKDEDTEDHSRTNSVWPSP